MNAFAVIPAKAGTSSFPGFTMGKSKKPDSRFRGNDDSGQFRQ